MQKSIDIPVGPCHRPRWRMLPSCSVKVRWTLPATRRSAPCDAFRS